MLSYRTSKLLRTKRKLSLRWFLVRQNDFQLILNYLILLYFSCNRISKNLVLSYSIFFLSQHGMKCSNFQIFPFSKTTSMFCRFLMNKKKNIRSYNQKKNFGWYEAVTKKYSECNGANCRVCVCVSVCCCRSEGCKVWGVRCELELILHQVLILLGSPEMPECSDLPENPDLPESPDVH